MGKVLEIDEQKIINPFIELINRENEVVLTTNRFDYAVQNHPTDTNIKIGDTLSKPKNSDKFGKISNEDKVKIIKINLLTDTTLERNFRTDLNKKCNSYMEKNSIENELNELSELEYNNYISYLNMVFLEYLKKHKNKTMGKDVGNPITFKDKGMRYDRDYWKGSGRKKHINNLNKLEMNVKMNKCWYKGD